MENENNNKENIKNIIVCIFIFITFISNVFIFIFNNSNVYFRLIFHIISFFMFFIYLYILGKKF